MQHEKLILLILLFFLFSIPVAAEEKLTLEFFGGSAFNIPAPINIQQDGYDNIGFIAHYETKPFYEAPYYAYRLGWWFSGKGWEVELIHHKIYLKNNPDEVQHFEISHGYNLLTLNRAWKRKQLIYRIGAGLVIAHPESEVRGKKFYEMKGGPFGTGYFYVSGPTVQGAVQRKLKIWRSLYITGEAKLTASYAVVPIREGLAKVPNAAIHGLFGIGYDF
jgi:hypothetical protein